MSTLEIGDETKFHFSTNQILSLAFNLILFLLPKEPRLIVSIGTAAPFSLRMIKEENQSETTRKESSSIPTETQRPLFISLNADATLFAVGLANGFRIYSLSSSNPIKELYRQEYDEGGIGCIECLGQSNIVALVGGGERPRFPVNRVMLWDGKASKYAAELDFRSPVLGLKISGEKLVVVLRSRLFVDGLSGGSVERLSVFDTHENETGVAAIVRGSMIAFPGRQRGCVQVVDITSIDGTKFSTIVAAHKHPISALCLDPKGALLATASTKGTVVRVFEVETSKLRHELRRGADAAEIQCLAFSKDSTKLLVSSDKGTAHIFSLKDEHTQKALKNRESSLRRFKDILPSYFASEWSPAHARTPPGRSIVCFLEDSSNALMVLSYDGTAYKFVYDPERGGPCIPDSATKFLLLSPNESTS